MVKWLEGLDYTSTMVRLHHVKLQPHLAGVSQALVAFEEASCYGFEKHAFDLIISYPFLQLREVTLILISYFLTC